METWTREPPSLQMRWGFWLLRGASNGRRLWDEFHGHLCPSHRGQNRFNLYRLARISCHPDSLLVIATVGRRDLNLIAVKGAGRHRNLFNAQDLEGHQLFLLFLHVEVAKAGRVTFS